MDSKEALRKLEEIKKSTAEAQSKLDSLKGRKEVLMEELEDMGFSSIKDAEKELSKLQKERDKIDTELEELFNEFSNKFPELF